MPQTQRKPGLCRRGSRRCAAARVGFLARLCRNPDGQTLPNPLTGAALSAALLFIGLGTNAEAAATDWHPVSSLQRTAERFLLEQIDADGDRVSVRAAPLDPRVQLPLCSAPTEAFLQRGSKMSNRMIVGVRCTGERPWKIYLTVDVVVNEAIYVAARTLPRGHVLTAADVTRADRDVAMLSGGYVTTLNDALGRRLKQPLIEGAVLTPRMLAADVAVRRGQSVTLTVRSDELAIRMKGKALMDGAVNQRIRVENSTSRRVVEGIVRSPEHVEVLVF